MVIGGIERKRSQRGPCLAPGHTENLRTHNGQTTLKDTVFISILTLTSLQGYEGGRDHDPHGTKSELKVRERKGAAR